MKQSFFATLALALGLLIVLTVLTEQTTAADNAPTATAEQQVALERAVFAGGCFWCIEADFEKLSGVYAVVSGYTGGEAATANYKTVSYSETGHYEAVEVSYNPLEVTYPELVEYFWRHIDPTDPDGQFCDKGSSYKSAIFYANDEQKKIVQRSLKTLVATKPFKADIVTEVLPTKPFYNAEEYHQDYYKKNPVRYRIYRTGCGRDRRIEQLWGG